MHLLWLKGLEANPVRGCIMHDLRSAVVDRDRLLTKAPKTKKIEDWNAHISIYVTNVTIS